MTPSRPLATIFGNIENNSVPFVASWGAADMNKSELINAVAGKAQVSKSEAERIMNAFISVVNENISVEGGIRIMGFGTLGVVERKARNGRNPITGQPITIESRNAPVFKASKELREAANRLPED